MNRGVGWAGSLRPYKCPLWGGPAVFGVRSGWESRRCSGLCYRRAMSFDDSVDNGSERQVAVLWGCELSGGKSSYTFHAPEDCGDEQQLVLHTLCLGETARDEFHVVEVETEDSASRAPVPLATLKPSVLPTVTLAAMELAPPVTLHLRAGSGPVYVSGQHVFPSESSMDEDEESEEEETPRKPRKVSRAKKGGAAKKMRLEKEALSNPLPAKGRGGGRGKKAAAKK